MGPRVRLAGAAVLAALALAGCHKRGGGDPEAASSRGLQVEAYDPPIPKAPLKGKLETLAHHPEDTPPAVAASSEAPASAASSAGPKG